MSFRSSATDTRTSLIEQFVLAFSLNLYNVQFNSSVHFEVHFEHSRVSSMVDPVSKLICGNAPMFTFVFNMPTASLMILGLQSGLLSGYRRISNYQQV